MTLSFRARDLDASPHAADMSGGRLRIGVVVLAAALLLAIGVVGYVLVNESQQRLIEQQALTMAETVARQAAAARSVYAREVAGKVKADGTGAARLDYHDVPGAIPLPAQFLKSVARQASVDADGLYGYRPVSKWNLNPEQGLDQPFLEWAWRELEKQGAPAPAAAIAWKPVFRIAEVGGKRTLRYLRADPASDVSCVNCHNAYEQSREVIARRNAEGVPAGRSFRLHQLLGAIYVEIPIDRVESLAVKESGRTISWLLVVLIAGLALLVGFIVLDGSRARRAARELHWRSRHDDLTRFPNRLNFEEQISQLIEVSAQSEDMHAVCILDLDQFKLVNDTCGHAVGDYLLCQVAEHLRECTRGSDVVARLGGDEFGVLLKHCAPTRAEAIAESICNRIRNSRFEWDDHKFAISVSIGVAPFVARSAATDQILIEADVACYSAKDAGRNQVRIYREDNTDIGIRTGEMGWVSRILDAIENRRILIYHQRIERSGVDAGHAHHEILARLVDEQGAIVPPGVFLPAAERYDLMKRLDLTIIDLSFEALRHGSFGELPNDGFISVNLSGQSLSDRVFLNDVKRMLSEHDVDPGQICFEITESVAIANLQSVKVFMHEMISLGVRFALDDFGTGVSSLTYLKELPVAYLKIDGAFIRDIVHDPVDRTLVDAINKMAHTMKLKTIAEYVENEAILNLLAELQVDYVQGFHVHKPEPVGQPGAPQRKPVMAAAAMSPA